MIRRATKIGASRPLKISSWFVRMPNFVYQNTTFPEMPDRSGRYLQKSSPKLIYYTWVRLVHNWVCLFPDPIGVFCHAGVFHPHMVQNKKQRFLSLTIFFSALQFHGGFFKTNGTLKGCHEMCHARRPGSGGHQGCASGIWQVVPEPRLYLVPPCKGPRFRKTHHYQKVQ